MKAWWIWLLFGTATAGNILSDEVDYLRDVKPLLMEKCSSCHGALNQEADLRLDAGSLIHKGSAEGPILVVGNALESKLIQRVSDSDPDQLMPPMDGTGEPLSSNQIDLLKQWIDQGAVVPEEESIPTDPLEHWAYQPPRKTNLPRRQGSNPIDLLIRKEQFSLGLHPVERADRQTLLRRVYFDLIGLPPTRKQLDAFVNDDSPDAWEKTVDELLRRPQYGERWGRHWMDVWRYSDWDGYKQELRGSQRHIWHWRDWIIDSLNSDKSYDQMIVEMLAADEVAPNDTQAIAATGYLARNYHKSNRNIWLDATVEHTAKAFLGMTLNCARCHDHKYDPVSQEMYYEFRAVFEPHRVRTDRIPGQANLKLDGLPRAFDAELSAVTFMYAGGDEKKPLKDLAIEPKAPSFLGGELQVRPVTLPVDSWFPAFREFVLAEEQTRLKNQLVESERKLKDSAIAHDPKVVPLNYAILALEYAVARLNVESFDARFAAEKARMYQMESAGRLEAQAAASERKFKFKQAELTLARKELAIQTAQSSPQKDAKQKQNTIDKLDKELSGLTKKLEQARENLKNADAVFTPLGEKYPKTSSGRRLALARWIARKDNPLTARVAVNHIWMRHFGAPLVENVFDFGLRSPLPRHAQLLDWLAVEFMEHDWSMKHLHRLILTSQTWQQVSSSNSDTATRNRTVDPENEYFWRANARRLDAEVVRDNVLAVSGQLDLKLGGPDIDFRQGETTRRRSIYLRHAYEKQMRMLVLFDTANPNECYRRSESIIPQQALAMVNSSLCQDQSRLLARQLWTEAAKFNDNPDVRFLNAAFEQVLGRRPTEAESDECLEFLNRQFELLSNPGPMKKFTGGKPAVVKPATEPGGRARENLVHVLMNHNDFVTVR